MFVVLLLFPEDAAAKEFLCLDKKAAPLNIVGKALAPQKSETKSPGLPKGAPAEWG